MKHRIPVAHPVVYESDIDYVTSALRAHEPTRGRYIDLFESRFAEYVGVRYAISCANGTVALHLLLKALGVGPGDEVIVPDLTFVATANAVTYCGATPVFADVDINTWTIDPVSVAKLLTPRTCGVIAVHLYGAPAPMRVLDNMLNDSMFIIEDAAQALGTRVDKVSAGALARTGGTFSFMGNKHITTGEGGMVTTNNSRLADRIRHLRGQGQCAEIHRYWHDEVAFNYRLSNMQCALGLGQMERLDKIVAHHRRIAQWFKRYAPDLQYQPQFPGVDLSNWMVTGLFETNDQMELAEHILARNGIETRRVFVPMRQLPMYQKGDFLDTNAYRISLRGLTFPTHQYVTEDHVKEIANVVAEVLHGQASRARAISPVSGAI